MRHTQHTTHTKSPKISLPPLASRAKKGRRATGRRSLNIITNTVLALVSIIISHEELQEVMHRKELDAGKRKMLRNRLINLNRTPRVSTKTSPESVHLDDTTNLLRGHMGGGVAASVKYCFVGFTQKVSNGIKGLHEWLGQIRGGLSDGGLAQGSSVIHIMIDPLLA